MTLVGSAIRLATEPGLNPDERDERLGGSTPSASVRTQSITKQPEARPFRHWHQYSRPTDAEANKVWNNNGGSLLVLGSDNVETKTKPRITPGLCCIKEKLKSNERKAMPMSPVALPPSPEYTEVATAAQQDPKVAFENLVNQAFALRERVRRQTAEVMVVLDVLALEARKSA